MDSVERRLKKIFVHFYITLMKKECKVVKRKGYSSAKIIELR